MQLVDFGGDNHAATTAKYFDMPRAKLAQFIDQILKVFDVPTLIRTDRDSVGVFLHRRLNDLLHRAVMSEVNDLYTASLQDSAHDIYCRIVAIEEACGGDKSERVLAV